MAQIRLVAGNKESVLVIHNGLHRGDQRMLALLDGVDEPFGGVDLFV